MRALKHWRGSKTALPGAVIAMAVLSLGLSGTPTRALADGFGAHAYPAHDRFVFYDGACRYKYVAGPHGIETRLRCRDIRPRHFRRHHRWHGYRRLRQPIRWAPPPGYHASPILSESRIVWWNAVDTPSLAPASRAGGELSYCREYQTTARIGGEERRAYGQACRMPDGSWRLGD